MLTIHVWPRRLKEFLLTHPLYKSPSSSWSLGEYAVSIRSDLRSTAKHSVDKTAVAEGL